MSKSRIKRLNLQVKSFEDALEVMDKQLGTIERLSAEISRHKKSREHWIKVAGGYENALEEIASSLGLLTGDDAHEMRDTAQHALDNPVPADSSQDFTVNIKPRPETGRINYECEHCDGTGGYYADDSRQVVGDKFTIEKPEAIWHDEPSDDKGQTDA